MEKKAIVLLSEAEKEYLLKQASVLMQDFFVIKQDVNDTVSFNKTVKNLFNRPIAKELSKLT